MTETCCVGQLPSVNRGVVQTYLFVNCGDHIIALAKRPRVRNVVYFQGRKLAYVENVERNCDGVSRQNLLG